MGPAVARRTRQFLLHHGPLLTTIAIFVLAYVIGGQLYPAMQRPQAFFNLFINNGPLLIVAIGMTFVILSGGIDLSVGGVLALTTTASAALLQQGAGTARAERDQRAVDPELAAREVAQERAQA
jgi:galactofuranose transport system permease protein